HVSSLIPLPPPKSPLFPYTTLFRSLEPERPFGAVASEIHDGAATVLYRIVQPIGKFFGDADLFGSLVAILHDDLLHRPNLARFHAMKQIVTRGGPGIPIIHHQFDSCLIR